MNMKRMAGRIRRLSLAVMLVALLLAVGGQAFAEEAEAEKNGEVIILYTSDIHCGVDENFGLVGLRQIRQVDSEPDACDGVKNRTVIKKHTH